jgi:hypothetical protein
MHPNTIYHVANDAPIAQEPPMTSHRSIDGDITSSLR